MTKPLTPEALSRARDLREMGATWSKVVALTGIPRVVLQEALRAATVPELVTRVETDGTTAIVRTVRERDAS